MQWLEANREHIKILRGILLKSVGNKNKLTMQRSYLGDSILDRAGMAAVIEEDEDCQIFGYREYYGNDETVFDAYGIEIPTITYTRFPFDEYHTNLDTPENIEESMLRQTEKVVNYTIDIIESNKRAKHIEQGLFCLSNPKYNLYKTAPEPGISDIGQSKIEKNWNLMMNCLQRDLGTQMSALDISLKYNIPYKQVLDYLHQWEEKGLIRLERI